MIFYISQWVYFLIASLTLPIFLIFIFPYYLIYLVITYKSSTTSIFACNSINLMIKCLYPLRISINLFSGGSYQWVASIFHFVSIFLPFLKYFWLPPSTLMVIIHKTILVNNTPTLQSDNSEKGKTWYEVLSRYGVRKIKRHYENYRQYTGK